MALLLSVPALSHGMQASPATRLGRGRLAVSAASSQPPMRSFPSPSSPNSNGSVSLGASSSSSAASSSAASSSGGGAAAASSSDAPAVKSYRVSPWQAMRFNGAVPERVNGRLAMMAFVYIARQEMLTGQTGAPPPRLHRGVASGGPGSKRARECSAVRLQACTRACAQGCQLWA